MGSHVTVARRDRYAGLAHAAIFYGFVTLLVGTIVLAINTDVTERIFGWRFFTGEFYIVYSFVLDVLGVAFLAGVLATMVRRGLIRPRKLDYARPDRAPEDQQYDRRRYRIGDWVFVGGLLYLLVTGFLLESVRMAMDVPGNAAASPVGWVAAQPLSAVPYSALEVLRHLVWWTHGLVAIAFVAALPYTKGMHMLTSFASLVLRDPAAGRRLTVIPAQLGSEPVGYTTLADFSPRHLLHLDACTKCGKCHEACPATATGQPLSPRDVVLELREQANAAWSQTGVGGVLGTLMAARSDARVRRGSSGTMASGTRRSGLAISATRA